MRRGKAVLAGLALAGLAMAICVTTPDTALAQTSDKSEPTMYERYAELKKDPAFAAKLKEPAQRIHDLDWMLGDWKSEAVVYATKTTPEWRDTSRTSFRIVGDAVIASDDLSTILDWDPFAKTWRSFGAEPPVSPLASSAGRMENGTLVLEGDVRLFGEPFHLRQTITRDGPDAFNIVNEQRLADGRYRAVDAYRYTRASTRN